MSLTRIHNMSISLDGFATGEPQSADAPFGHAGERLHEWMFGTRFWDADGTTGVDDAFAERHSHGIGAEIMGANKFGPPGWDSDPDWKGWWGPNPPFHTPTFVLTHHPRASMEMEGGTTFHFLDAEPAEALVTARAAADGQDVRIGGGPTVVRSFLAAGLVDHMHLVQVPILLGHLMDEALNGLDHDAPLRESCDGADRIQSRLHLDRHTQAQLRIVLDLFSLAGPGRRTARAATM